MHVSSRGTWLRSLGGLLLAMTLFAAYLLFRDGWSGLPPPTFVERVLVFGVLATFTAWIVGRSTCRYYDQVFLGLSNQVAALRQHPALYRVQALPAELGELQKQIEGLAHSYRQALNQVVEAQQALAVVRSLQVKADAEKGHSHSFIHRGGSNDSTTTRRLVARLTPNLYWMAATPALQMFLDSNINDLVARSFLDLIHSEDRASLARTFQEVLKDGEGHNVVFRLCLPAGIERHVQMDALTRYTDAGVPLHLRCHFIDVTDRVRTEQELRRRTQELSEANVRLRQINIDLNRLKESYRDLYHQAPAMYFSLDARGRLTAFNETLTRIMGYSRGEIFDQPYPRLLTAAARQRYFQDVDVYQRPGEVETEWVKKDGTVIDVWIRTVPILDSDSRFVRSRSAAQDVTERNRLAGALRKKAEELAEANDQLRRINQELDQFTYVVSHDLKEPLRTLQAFSTFLRQDYGPQLGREGQEHIEHLVQASRRLGALIDDLLTLSRAGRAMHAPRAFPLADAVRTVRSDLGDLIQRTGAAVHIEGELPRVVGDPERVVQLLANLVGNGLKYNGSPRPEVVIGSRTGANGDVSRPPGLAPPGFVTVYVRDNGIGIEPQYQEQIFHIFRRLHHRDEYEGTGAGLAICKKIVESHGGRIGVESRPGAGSVFSFTLPQARETGARAGAAVSGDHLEARGAGPSPEPGEPAGSPAGSPEGHPVA
jgi:PAS domain S-box-containing protein